MNISIEDEVLHTKLTQIDSPKNLVAQLMNIYEEGVQNKIQRRFTRMSASSKNRWSNLNKDIHISKPQQKPLSGKRKSKRSWRNRRKFTVVSRRRQSNNQICGINNSVGKASKDCINLNVSWTTRALDKSSFINSSMATLKDHRYLNITKSDENMINPEGVIESGQGSINPNRGNITQIFSSTQSPNLYSSSNF